MHLQNLKQHNNLYKPNPQNDNNISHNSKSIQHYNKHLTFFQTSQKLSKKYFALCPYLPLQKKTTITQFTNHRKKQTQKNLIKPYTKNLKSHLNRNIKTTIRFRCYPNQPKTWKNILKTKTKNHPKSKQIHYKKTK